MDEYSVTSESFQLEDQDLPVDSKRWYELPANWMRRGIWTISSSFGRLYSSNIDWRQTSDYVVEVIILCFTSLTFICFPIMVKLKNIDDESLFFPGFIPTCLMTGAWIPPHHGNLSWTISSSG